jgi:hypothetical protein
MRDETLTFTAAKNESNEAREAKVSIYFGDGEEVSSTIYQEGVPQQEETPILQLEPGQNFEINPEGEDIDIKVLSNVDYTVEIPAEATWLHEKDKAQTRAEATQSIVTLYASKNDTGEKRSAVVKLSYEDKASVTFTVSQEPAQSGNEGGNDDGGNQGGTTVPDGNTGSGNTGSDNEDTYTFVLNTSSKKIHDPSCGSVATMAEKNKKKWTGTYAELQELLSSGYTTCGTCKPAVE